jgi:hypothetical protein
MIEELIKKYNETEDIVKPRTNLQICIKWKKRF